MGSPSSLKLFFPGMIFHELSHYLACVLLGVRVRSVRFFDAEGAYVLHDRASAWKSIIITLAPFILGNWFALELLRFGNTLLFHFNPAGFLAYWLALSLIIFSFPSFEDSRNSFNSFKEFYSRRILKQGTLFHKLFWLATLPFVFIPLLIVLALMIAFNHSALLRAFWIIFMLFFSYNPGIAFQFFSEFEGALESALPLP